ncbi:ABC transporter permease [Heyndrickxia camelliae]|uniref:Transport permease protein n=1 Tax=Heyndrickxia camelliae TaxID=1707093 RepID=A0A2N3LND1_9BACI|nr:ABC transporter permease [Heyndrickxia camelliae]PKR86192.1 teichoic acid ABC transporter permease [Heyndrickxia camelliae]
MKSVFTVIKEQFKSIYLISRLSAYEVKSANKNNYLGILWEVINPMIQIGVYWIVFGVGITGRKGEGDIAYFPWMIAGIVAWFFINPAITQGTKAIYSRIKMVAKMSFPLSVIPSYVIIAKFYQHLMLLVVIMVILHFYGFTISIHYIELPYYMFAAIVLTFSISLITSTLATIVRDVNMIVTAIMRMMIYLAPILWAPTTGILAKYQGILKLNPIYYIIEGYRNSLLSQKWYLVSHWHYTLYFWAVILVLLFIGSVLHVKFRNRFVDFL